MKTKLAILFCVVALQVSAQNPSIIEINSDSTFLLRDVLNLSDGQHLYGEKSGRTQYGGDNDRYFNNHQVTVNQKPGIEISRDSVNQIQVKITYNKLSEDTVSLAFFMAVNKNSSPKKPDWCPDKSNKVSLLIIKVKNEPKSNSGVVPGSHEPEESKSEESKSEESKSEESGFSQGICGWFNQQRWNLTIGAFLILTLSFISYVILIRKALRRKSETMSSFKKQMESMESEIESLRTLIKESKTNSNAKISSESLTRSEIEKIIEDKLSQKQLAEPAVISVSTKDQNKKPILVENIDTSEVVWNSEDLSFKIGIPDMQIFRIYSRGNHYFYTIVSDEETRKELVSMISSFSAFYTSESTLSNARRVEPLEDGKLIKEGDIYRVDPNNKMKVRFV